MIKCWACTPFPRDLKIVSLPLLWQRVLSQPLSEVQKSLPTVYLLLIVQSLRKLYPAILVHFRKSDKGGADSLLEVA